LQRRGAKAVDRTWVYICAGVIAGNLVSVGIGLTAGDKPVAMTIEKQGFYPFAPPKTDTLLRYTLGPPSYAVDEIELFITEDLPKGTTCKFSGYLECTKPPPWGWGGPR
jgi:hypothetical protein